MSIKIFLLIFGLSFVTQAQTLSGDYQGYLYSDYCVGKYEKDKYVLIDSIKLDDKGKFTKVLNPKIYTPNTSYIIVTKKEYEEKKNIANSHPHSSIRFVYIGNDINYKTSWRQETGYLKFLKGGEPSNHIKELKIRLGETQGQLNGMDKLLAVLKADDPMYKKLMEDYTKKATAHNAFCQSIAKQYPKGSYINVYALMFQQVVPKKGMSYKAFEEYRAKNMFQFTDLKNPLIVNVPMFQKMFSSYLYYNQPSENLKGDVIQKRQADAKAYIQKRAAPKVLEVLNLPVFSPEAEIKRNLFVNELPFDDLYKDDKAWFTDLNDILGAYHESSPYHSLFGADAIIALERTKKPKAYTKLAEAVLSITKQFNWADAQAQVLDYLIKKSDKRLLKGKGKLAKIFELKKKLS